MYYTCIHVHYIVGLYFIIRVINITQIFIYNMHARTKDEELNMVMGECFAFSLSSGDLCKFPPYKYISCLFKYIVG